MSKCANELILTLTDAFFFSEKIDNSKGRESINLFIYKLPCCSECSILLTLTVMLPINMFYEYTNFRPLIPL